MFLFRLNIFIKIILAILASWIIVHLLGAFGIFLALAYPVWCVLSRNKTYCIACSIGKPGTNCAYCNTPISLEDKSPKNAKSVFLNSVTILLLSIISALLIFLEFKLIVNYNLIGPAPSAKFDITPSGTYRINEVFDIDVNLKDVRSPINVLQADVSYDPNLLEVVEITATDTIASVFIEKEINNEIGYSRFSGGIPNPGFKGELGQFCKFRFRAKNKGVGQIKFLPSSVVLANDGYGTNVLRELPTSSVLILDQIVDEYENNKKRQLDLGNVLGESKDSAKLYLYDDKPVLGAATKRPDSKEEASNKPNISQYLFFIISEIDNWILKIWNFILSSIGSLINIIKQLLY